MNIADPLKKYTRHITELLNLMLDSVMVQSYMLEQSSVITKSS